jgi:rubrerythrin
LLNQDKKASNLVEKLASNEEFVARLYKGYANAFPVLREFWISLAAEEMKHASWIRNLGVKSETRRIFVEEGRFNTVAIQTFMNYLDKELARLNEQEIPLIEALSITLYIEQSLIESKSFEVFKTDSAELKHTLTKLRDDTLAHRNKAKEELETYKKNQ